MSSETEKTAAMSNDGSQDWDMIDDAKERPCLSLSVLPRHASIGVSSGLGTTQICATVKARELPDDENQRAPVDIMVALDVSGSMTGEKLALCKTSLELLLRQLLPHDRFGLVSFSDDAVLEIPLAKLTSDHKKSSLAKIKALDTRGCTNISAAVGTAVPMLQMVDSPSEVRTVFLLTDGLANMGTSNHPDLVALTKNWLAGSLSSSVEAGSPINLHCFGYGANHDSKLLQEMSQSSQGGTYYFVENDSNVTTAIGDALGGVLSVVAQTAILHISVPEEAKAQSVEIIDVHHDKKIKRDDGSFTVSIGDFYAEENRDVLFDVKLAPYVSVAPTPHAAVSLSYTDTLLKRPSSQGPVVCSIARPPGAEVSEPNKHVIVQGLRIKTAQELANAEKLSRDGLLDVARAKIKNMVNEIKVESTVQSDPLVEQLIADLNNVNLGLASRETYRAFGGHRMMNTFQSHTMQRCVDSAPRASNAYRGHMKTKTAKKFTMD